MWLVHVWIVARSVWIQGNLGSAHVKLGFSGQQEDSSLPNRVFMKISRNQNQIHKNVHLTTNNKNPALISIETSRISWIEPKKPQHQNLLKHKKFQKWWMSIPIGPLDHTHDKSKLHFHGNKLWRENRAKKHMNNNLYFQISCKILNQITWDKVHNNQHTKTYTKHGMVWQNK